MLEFPAAGRMLQYWSTRRVTQLTWKTYRPISLLLVTSYNVFFCRRRYRSSATMYHVNWLVPVRIVNHLPTTGEGYSQYNIPICFAFVDYEKALHRVHPTLQNTGEPGSWACLHHPPAWPLQRCHSLSTLKLHRDNKMQQAQAARLHTIITWSLAPFIHMPSQLLNKHTALLPSRSWKLFKHTEAFNIPPGTHLLPGWESGCVGKVPCLGAPRLGTVQPNWFSNLRSLPCKSRTLPPAIFLWGLLLVVNPITSSICFLIIQLMNAFICSFIWSVIHLKVGTGSRNYQTFSTAGWLK